MLDVEHILGNITIEVVCYCMSHLEFKMHSKPSVLKQYVRDIITPVAVIYSDSSNSYMNNRDSEM